MATTAAYQQGYDAGMQGFRCENPYPPGSSDYEDFIEGWGEAELMLEDRRCAAMEFGED